ncbi:MAG: Eco57I restriction-modification methylase domain-containing protein, partial [Psychromonas sp.]|nr:Eco57I restriction-modification methylase domain-containing protein [Psychromonas sp.]
DNYCDRTIHSISTTQDKFLSSKTSIERKELGQFFTGSAVSDYMASMIDKIEGVDAIRILDGGAGAGILTGSLAIRCLDLGYKNVHAVLYEIDRDVITHLAHNLSLIKELFNKNNSSFSFETKMEDLILSRPDKTEAPFHFSSINPPYFKYNSKNSPYSGATADLFKGNPNIYASFLAVVSACLAPNGQMVSITPRSFTNGLYFKGLRRYLSEKLSLEKIHIFSSRNKVFKNSGVLQENVICKYVKSHQSSKVTIYSSSCESDINNSETNVYPYEFIVDRTNEHNMTRIPESKEDSEILKKVENWTIDFQESGYFISTGPIVEHRAREFITQNKLNNSVPLLRMHNLKLLNVEWTGEHKKDARFILSPGHEKHTRKNNNYVILKRFSSKDEKRRLVASVYDPKTIPGELIGLENHLNYIGINEGEIQLEEAYGLASLLNSTFFDKYFRCVSGNTQVNATEIRLMKLPEKEKIIAIGKSILKANNKNQTVINNIVNIALFSDDI